MRSTALSGLHSQYELSPGRGEKFNELFFRVAEVTRSPVTEHLTDKLQSRALFVVEMFMFVWDHVKASKIVRTCLRPERRGWISGLGTLLTRTHHQFMVDTIFVCEIQGVDCVCYKNNERAW